MKKQPDRKPRRTTAKKAATGKKRSSTKTEPARGNPDGPPVRGRKNHSTIDDTPDLRTIVKDLYYAHPDWSIEQKLDHIHENHPEFRTLSWSALQRWYDNFQRHIVEGDTLLSLARALKTSIDEDGLMLTSVAGELAQTKVYEAFLSGADLTKEDLQKINAQSRLNSSAATRERARRSVEKDIRRGAMRVKDDLRKTLKGHPEIAEKLAAMIDARIDQLVDEVARR